MKRLTILGIIACVGLLFAPAAVIGDPAGPPGGLDVNVVNPVPLPVTGTIDATVTGEVNANVVNEPGVTVLNNDTNPVPVNVQSGGPPVYRFVGITEALTTGSGGEGIVGMNTKCQAVRVGARMCTSKEVFDTGLTSFNNDASAWVAPSISDVTLIVSDDGRQSWVGHTVEGMRFESNSVEAGVHPREATYNCFNWTSAERGANGTVLSAFSGSIAFSFCDTPRAIACCAPAPSSP